MIAVSFGVILSFGDSFSADLFEGTVNARTRGYPSHLLDITRRKLDMLDNAHVLADLQIPPGNRLEALRGDLRGFHSIRINRQWRVTFRWTSAGPEDVQVVDYH